MTYALHAFAREQFPDVADRKLREHLAETRLVRMFFEDATDGVFVDVGAHAPKSASQSWHLEEAGWHGLLVEPIESLYEACRRERPRSVSIRAACGRGDGPETVELLVTEDPAHSTIVADAVEATDRVVRTEQVRLASLDTLIAEAELDVVDFVSIDVEGATLDVLGGFDLARHRPRLVLVEDHMLDLSVHRHLTGAGYRLVKRTAFNSWYVPKDHPFTLTTPGERFALQRKLWRTPVRRLRHRIRRGLGLRD